jgi:hypothetical protein
MPFVVKEYIRVKKFVSKYVVMAIERSRILHIFPEYKLTLEAKCTKKVISI